MSKNTILFLFALLQVASAYLLSAQMNLGKPKDQIYGIPTYDAMFKHVLSKDSIRLSFLNTFMPELNITSSERLDEHMNPIQELRSLRKFVHSKNTEQVVAKLSEGGVVHGSYDSSHTFVKDEEATTFFGEIVPQFDDIGRAFSGSKYDGVMDFACTLDSGEYALVEVQVNTQYDWNKRALAYIAAYYGNNLHKGDQWKNIERVIGINDLDGGKD